MDLPLRSQSYPTYRDTPPVQSLILPRSRLGWKRFTVIPPVTPDPNILTFYVRGDNRFFPGSTGPRTFREGDPRRTLVHPPSPRRPGQTRLVGVEVPSTTRDSG